MSEDTHKGFLPEGALPFENELKDESNLDVDTHEKDREIMEALSAEDRFILMGGTPPGNKVAEHEAHVPKKVDKRKYASESESSDEDSEDEERKDGDFVPRDEAEEKKDKRRKVAKETKEGGKTLKLELVSLCKIRKRKPQRK